MKSLFQKGLTWRARFDPNLFKLKTIFLKLRKSVNFFTKWHHNIFSSSKWTHIYLKIPTYFNEPTLLNKEYLEYEPIDGDMIFTFRSYTKPGWEIDEKRLKDAINSIEYHPNSDTITTSYTPPIPDLTFEHFLIGFYMEYMPNASYRELSNLTGIYPNKVKKFVNFLQDKLLHSKKPFLRRLDIPNYLQIKVESNEVGIYNLMKDIGELFPMWVLSRIYDVNYNQFNLSIYLPINSVSRVIYYLKDFLYGLGIKNEIEVIKWYTPSVFIDIREYFDEENHDWIFEPKKQIKIIRKLDYSE